MACTPPVRRNPAQLAEIADRLSKPAAGQAK